MRTAGAESYIFESAPDPALGITSAPAPAPAPAPDKSQRLRLSVLELDLGQ